jgi:hypothetical protein
MAYTKNRQFYDRYPELYFNNIGNNKIDYTKSFVLNLSNFFRFGLPSNQLIVDDICRIFSNKYYYDNNMVFKNMNSVYALAYASTIYTAHTDMTYDDFIRVYDKICKDVIIDDYMRSVYSELQNTSFL